MSSDEQSQSDSLQSTDEQNESLNPSVNSPTLEPSSQADQPMDDTTGNEDSSNDSAAAGHEASGDDSSSPVEQPAPNILTGEGLNLPEETISDEQAMAERPITYTEQVSPYAPGSVTPAIGDTRFTTRDAAQAYLEFLTACYGPHWRIVPAVMPTELYQLKPVGNPPQE